MMGMRECWLAEHMPGNTKCPIVDSFGCLGRLFYFEESLGGHVISVYPLDSTPLFEALSAVAYVVNYATHTLALSGRTSFFCNIFQTRYPFNVHC
jgi:hypothetical protein